MTRLFFAFALTAVLAGCDATTLDPLPPTEPPTEPGELTLVAVPAPEWTALFDRESGWTGADGIYSVPVNGVDAPGTAAQTTTTFLFSDTAIGDVRPDGSRAPGTVLVNNTLAHLAGGAPDAGQVGFFWPVVNGQARPLVAPSTPASQPGDWYWNQDGIVQGQTLHSLFLRIRRPPAGFFEVAGVSLVSWTAVDGLPTDIVQRDTPFFRPDRPGRGNIQFGAAFMANTVEAGAPHPDGFLYVYGVQNDGFNKKLLVACLRPSDLTHFGLWRFWNGTTWGPRLDDAATVTDRVSNELSVTPLADGRFLLVSQLDAVSPYVAVRIGESPVGPWSAPETVYTCPEAATDPDTFCYNAKAHPHLSAPGELLISYNVNTRDFFGDFFADADIYRPRFIRLTGLPAGPPL